MTVTPIEYQGFFIHALDRIVIMLFYAVIIIIPIVFISLFFTTAAYGRHVQKSQLSETSKKGPLLVSKRLGWIILEVPAMLTILIVWCFSEVGFMGLVRGRMDSLVFLLFVIVWEMHYIYRSSVSPFLYSDEKNKFRIYVLISGVLFNIVNGLINGWFLFFRIPYFMKSISSESILSYLNVPMSISGILLFFIGFSIHFRSDNIFLEIKKSLHYKYGIPYTFLHKYVASPNYFGEIIQWWGWALFTQSIAGVVFALFTMANLIPRAFSNLRWYRKTFPDYPKNRKALIPFIL